MMAKGSARTTINRKTKIKEIYYKRQLIYKKFRKRKITYFRKGHFITRDFSADVFVVIRRDKRLYYYTSSDSLK